MCIYRLDNPVQKYEWGSTTEIPRIFNISNPESDPIAEVWIGTHPKAPSRVIDGDRRVSLPDFISGSNNQLPFLLKVLSAAHPLSIQVHPNKEQAEAGYQHEQELHIPLNSPSRNYRDNNHKPELVYAITPFRVMSGFRPAEEIESLFHKLNFEPVSKTLDEMKQGKGGFNIELFFTYIMSLSPADKNRLLQKAADYLPCPPQPEWSMVQALLEEYPGDIGALSPILFNCLELQPGEAMYIEAGTPHAYLSGTALEIMACSDNVLRGGLTHKHIDVPEFLKTLVFPLNTRHAVPMKPLYYRGQLFYPSKSHDFQFSIISASDIDAPITVHSSEILFWLDGKGVVETGDGRSMSMAKGQSCFIRTEANSYRVYGTGRVARATCAVPSQKKTA